MDLRVQGSGPTAPFLSARDLFETEHDLECPVRVRVRTNPDERTWTAHYEDYHVLNISAKAASSAMARELALHEYAHMRRYEEAHPSHRQPTEEALFLALAGHSVERHDLIDDDHRLYDLAHAAANDAPGIGLTAFKRHFASLTSDPDRSEYRKALVDVTREYCVDSAAAAD